MIVLVMGVSGSGKSTLAESLAKRTGWPFAEGDDYHSDANKAKMHAGIPLTDQDRLPWLDALHGVLAAWELAGSNGVMTCSALKESYRERLFAGIDDGRLVWLDPPRAVLEQRLAARTGHYMNPRLLDSQLSTLEAPVGANVLHLTSGQSTEQAAAEAAHWLGI